MGEVPVGPLAVGLPDGDVEAAMPDGVVGAAEATRMKQAQPTRTGDSIAASSSAASSPRPCALRN
jgi:hypothetical protein